ncbi:MAG TPA: hypothetical protein VGL65_12055 [Gemmatimonadales bacterium]
MPAPIGWRARIRRAFLAAMTSIVRVVRGSRPRRIVVYYAWRDFARKSEAIADILRQSGLPVEVRSGLSFGRRIRNRVSTDLWIAFWNEYFMDYLPANYIFFNAEPLHVPQWRDDAEWFAAMRKAREVWGYSAANARSVEPLGVPFRHVPFGYAPYYEASYQRHTAGKALVEDINLLFVGQLSPRRQRLVLELENQGMPVHTVTLFNPVYGEQLDELLARAKIVLGIHQYDDSESHVIDFARVDHLLANRRFVIHESAAPASADAAFSAHVITCGYDEIAERCADYLARPDERRRIADAAHDWFKTERSLADALPIAALREYLQQP